MGEEGPSKLELIRLKNIEQLKARIAPLQKELDESVKHVRDSIGNISTTKKRKSLNHQRDKTFTCNIRRLRKGPTRKSRRLNREACSDVSYDSDSSTECTPLKVKFSWNRRSNHAGEADGDSLRDSMNGEVVKRRVSVNRASLAEVIPPDKITEKMLAGVADCTSSKVYDDRGTTCHQCRQKTRDTKTICRSGKCRGRVGYFCGPCLRNRYGQDVRAALLDETWACPVCREICNCSIHRNRKGLCPTGIMTHTAKAAGYHSVHDFLQAD